MVVFLNRAVLAAAWFCGNHKSEEQQPDRSIGALPLLEPLEGC